MDILYFLLIGACAGWLSGQIMKTGSFGITGNIIVGVIGAILGGFVFRLLGLSVNSLMGSLIMATSGAVLLLILLGAINQKKRR